MTKAAARGWLRGALLASCAGLALSACADSGTMGQPGQTAAMAAAMNTPAPQGQPGVPFSGAQPDADMKAVLDAVQALGYRPIETLTPQMARQQPTAADGVKEVMRRQGMPATPPPGVTTRDVAYTSGTLRLPARVYMPANAAGAGPLPVIVYYHGGGWVIADVNTYDSTPRALVRETQAIVVSVEYRHAPEAKFPSQHEDAFAAYRWVLANAASFGGDPRRIAVAGESAGGNLAANMSIMARDQGIQMPVHQLLVYPVAGADMGTPSYRENANAKPLNRAMMMWFAHHTGRTPADLMDPRINLVAANLRGLPPTTVVLAQIDPLRSDGMMLADGIKAGGADVAVRTYDGVTHEFFGMDAVVQDARDAQAFAGQRLRASFGR